MAHGLATKFILVSKLQAHREVGPEPIIRGFGGEIDLDPPFNVALLL
jgi:hypothetical protein